MGFPIRKFLDQSLFAAPQNLSQRTTSFIASQRQGIHRIPLRHLIALIINAHPLARASQTPRQRSDRNASHPRRRTGVDQKASVMARPKPRLEHDHFI